MRPMRDCEAKAGSKSAAPAGCGPLAPRSAALVLRALTAFLVFASLALGPRSAVAASDASAKSVALLNVRFLNDHEDLEPTKLLADISSSPYPRTPPAKSPPVQRSAPAAAVSSASAKSSAPIMSRGS